MKLLILGGTQFIGKHLTQAALLAGYQVTVFNRGRSPDDLPQQVERLRGDRDQGVAGLSALMGQHWDACFDVSGYTPRQVRASAGALQGRVGRYVYVSSRAVYAEPCGLPITEASPLQAPAAEDITQIDGETYGPLKVACEEIVQGLYADACTVLRPQIVVGPHDPTRRYPYWAERALLGGVMLAPGDGTDHLQVIDVRDVARFALRVVEADLDGVFNLAGPRLTWTDFLRICGAGQPATAQVRWIDIQMLRQHFPDAEELSLYVAENGPHAGRMNVSNVRAVRAGLTLTDPATTARDTQAWSCHQKLPYALTPEGEAALLGQL
ncbi:NAD-dependent epimerase/dehydratase family protein [Deinococcus rubellus]|uniref:UDP-glucose 4-epimerase n=1 Tax=Deinococcus rubellus TaxID=1889240 RepID=A0ABY5YJJ0_9DEIO|nr:NAD-dependent epimerase/dehydratase family protein [Deinococcus rubellus]UWX64257.1 NAD-dependent epimerase/dehydratase family protein [Deinococcus rubellus]